MIEMELFSVQLQKDDKCTEIVSTEFRCEKDFCKNGKNSENSKNGESKFFVYENSGDKIGIRIRKRNSDGEQTGSAEIDVQGPSALISFRYPWVICKDVSTFDNLLMSTPWGDNIERPCKTIRDVSTSTSIRFGQDYIKYAHDEVIYTYPSIMAMQYMTLYNPSRSVYLASYSLGDETETFHAKSLGKSELSLSIRHYPFLQNGKWSSPECSVAVLGGGWHPAAKLYASRMGSNFKTPNSPAWMRDSFHGWAVFVIKRENQPVNFTFKDLPKLYADVFEKTGIDNLLIAGWHDNGHDTKFPRFLAHEAAGTPEDLKKSMDEIKKMGGRVLLYINARLVDINEEYYKQKGHRAVSLNSKGEPYIETYGTESVFAVTCPGCKEYRGQMSDVTKRICEEYGAHGMFVDQISCNLAPFCYSKEHWHTKPSNNFLLGIDEELKAIRKAHRDTDPDFFTVSEGCHERFNQFYDVNQGHGEEYTWQIGKSMPEQFSYTFPDRIVTGICHDKAKLHHTMAQFKPLDIFGTDSEIPAYHATMREYIALRKQYPKYFLQGRFQDDEGFTYSEGMRLFTTKAADGSLCVCLFMPGSDDGAKNIGYIKIPEGYGNPEAIYPSNAETTPDGKWIAVNWSGVLCYFLLSAGI
ncbi:MAG: DUF6259 domain-containing protein [Defluviitaleaceae bacterium]|nr:DUF6259 domain-containing protein [Defluviitaleaceae bacterium]